MEPLTSETDDVSRFAALRSESLRLLDDARALVGEMRSALDDCKRHRPPVETLPDADGRPVFPRPLKTHRGARVMKRRGVRRHPK